MREIKFRAWDKKHRKIIYAINHFLYFCGIIRSIGAESVGGGSWCGPSENYELMQFTGLKDCEGREIYEGDIIKTLAHVLTFGELIGDDIEISSLDPSPVEFVDGGFHVCGHDLYDIASGFYGDCKIIGNIYENPELLKSES